MTLSFFLLAPLTTYVLLMLKGFPSFAVEHMGEVLIWVYGVTWVPSLLAGLLLSGILSWVIRRTAYFHKPYDFGRCFSLGAIAGALAEALATAIYRGVSHRPFSDFWIAGSMIAGCLAGAAVTSVVLWRYSVGRR